MKNNKIYFAGPLFCQAEKEYNINIVKILENNGYEVFFPQRDGYEFIKLSGTIEEKNKKIFQKDITEINNADILFLIADGRVVDEGACVELGYAFAKQKEYTH